MRKRNYTLMTLALAGVIVFSGSGLLSLKISDARTKEVTTEEEKDTNFAGQIEDVVELEEKSGDLHNKKEIDLADGEKVKEEVEYVMDIGDREITFISSVEGEDEADIGTATAIQIAIKSIERYATRDNMGTNFEISLHKNIPQGDESVSLKEGTRDDSNDIDTIVNRKNYGIRYYAVDFEGKGEHSYSLRINSVTGEVFGYADYYNKDASGYYKEYDKKALEKIEPEYKKIAKEFIKENLDLDDVKECYAFTTGFMETENGSRNTFDICCKTKGDDIVVITMDQLEKFVLCFEVNPLLD